MHTLIPAGFLLFVLQSTSLAAAAGIDLRLPAIALFAIGLLAQTSPVRVPRVALAVLLLTLGVACAQRLLLPDLEAALVEPVLGLLFGAIAVVAIFQTDSSRAAGWVLFSLALTGTWDLPQGARATGLFNNSNALGIAAVLALFLLGGRDRGWRLWLPMAAMVVISSSRASFGALVIYSILEHRSAFRHLRTWLKFCFASAAFSLIYQLDSTLFRTNNSRERTVDIGLSAVEEGWPGGLGMGTRLDAIVASSPIRVSVELGAAGLALFLLFVALCISATARHSSTIALPLLFHSLFEGWFISGGSWILVISLLELSRTGESRHSTDSRASHPGYSSQVARSRPVSEGHSSHVPL